ncbi:caveolae-associated protein 1 [Oncorhynchus tshawytscha]|uniref:Polymerase I and transcript release factor n=1 Tax=Oncorhynchus tshawytscha TaxID=74940 RepID=A0A8C8K0P2_ONCTS|nr:caveolae-associated protein 1 [Oncorhynchus tshawytscha]
MADPAGLQKGRVSLTEVSDDDEEVSLVAAAVQPATDSDEDDLSEDVDLVLATGTKSEAQVNGVMVLTLLDKIIGVVDQIQQTQNGLETRQQDMEKSVSCIQGELAKLSKSHTGTANTVNKMLDKVRKVSVNVKTVRTNLEKQAGQIKKLESNENELLKRRHFKVLIYQDENKAAKASLKSSKVAENVAEGCSVEGGLEQIPEEGGEAALTGLNSDEEVEIEEIIEESRAEKIKRSSKARVDNIKKAFSKEQREKRAQKTKDNLEKTKQKTRDNLEKTRQKTHDKLEKTKHSLEKKMGKLGNKMTPNMERKEKLKGSKEMLKKSLTPDHTVYARSKTTVYRVPPFTFHVKKFRDGDVEVVHTEGTEMVEVAENEALQAGEGDVEVEELVRVVDTPEMAAVLELDEEEEELVRVDTPEMAAFLEVAEDQVAEHLIRLESKLPVVKTSMKTTSK